MSKEKIVEEIRKAFELKEGIVFLIKRETYEYRYIEHLESLLVESLIKLKK